MSIDRVGGNGFEHAIAGMERGRERMGAAAKTLSEEGVDVEALVDLRRGRSEFVASAKVARAWDESLGQLIDELA